MCQNLVSQREVGRQIGEYKGEANFLCGQMDDKKDGG